MYSSKSRGFTAWLSANISISSLLAIHSRVSNHAKAKARPTETLSSFSKAFSFHTAQNECHVKLLSFSQVNTFVLKITIFPFISKEVSILHFGYFSWNWSTLLETGT